MDRYQPFWFGPVLVVALLSSACAPSKPNIVFMMADDLGWMDTTVYGSTFYETPNIDRLAERGITFINAYAHPLCSPTRASVLTGQYPGRLRFTTPAGHLEKVVLDPQLAEKGQPEHRALQATTRTRLPNEYFTIAEAVKEAGYRTGFFGKWHLGRAPYIPENQGFEVVVGGRHHPAPPTPGRYFTPWDIETIPEQPDGRHITDVIGDAAVKFIRDAAQRKQAFFCNLWFYSVHAPYQGKEELIEKYLRKVRPDNPQRSPTMGAMIDVLDQNVGKVIDALDDLGIAGDTVIIFYSDNGGNMYDTVDGTTPTNNSPLRSGKGNLYEGGSRVPLIVVWPGLVKPARRSDAVVTTVDFFPTLREMTGARPNPDQVVDGVSFVPALRGRALPRDAIFCHFPHYTPATGNLPGTWVRKGDWKLIRFYCDREDQTDRFELYNLADDIGETNNLAGSRPELVDELDALIDRHLAETDPLIPLPNPGYRHGVDNWWPSEQAKLSKKDGVLVLESRGTEPHITTSYIPRLLEPLEVELRIRSASRGQARVVWSVNRETFNDKQSAPLNLRHDNTWQTYTVSLDLKRVLNGLRIQPASASGSIEIDWVRLRDGSGRRIAAWDFD